MSRSATLERKTSETEIRLTLNLDGSGVSKISTGLAFFDHMLTLFAKHGLMDLALTAKGDIEVDFHHTVEDTGILLGQAITKALGDKASIRRYGFFYVPMDEALVRSVVDLSGRPFLAYNAPADVPAIGSAFSFQLVEEFLRGREASFFVVTDGVHARVLPTAEDHKRAFDGDKGPNTGGMGAFSPSPRVTDSLAERNRRALWGAMNAPGDDAAISRDSLPLASRGFRMVERV
jgi:imidazoleglycerol-phosphate dehydratase